MEQLFPIVNQSFPYVSGLSMQRASVTTLSFTPGYCRDSNNIIDLQLTSAITCNAAVNGVNGLDSGSLANTTWYYGFIIGDSKGIKTTATLLSTSKTAPTLPAGYDSFRWVGVALTSGAAQFNDYLTKDDGLTRRTIWTSAITALSGGSATTITTVAMTSGVPPLSDVMALCQVLFTPNAAGNSVSFNYGGATNADINLSGVVASQIQQAQLELPIQLVSNVPEIVYINSAASCSTTLTVKGFSYNVSA